MKYIKTFLYNLRELVEQLKGIKKKGSFAQNFSYSLSGNLFGIIFSTIVAPILTRIYPPESFGSFSIYTAIIINISSISLLSYNIALILPKDEDKFYNLLRLTYTLVTIVSLVVLLITFLLHDTIITFFTIQNIGNYIYLLPPAIFIAGSSSILTQWLTRDKEFKKMTIVNSLTVFLSKSMAIITGVITKGNVSGFIVGDILGKSIALFVLLKSKLLIIFKEFFTEWDLKEILATVKEFKRYPLMVLPGEYINMFSGQLPIYIISIFYGNKELGYFAFAATILEMPLTLLGNSVRPVFYQKATNVFNENTEQLAKITLDLFKYLFLLGVIPFSVLTVYGDVIFKFIFGSQWIQSGLFAGILGYYYIFRLISSPISSILWVLKKENIFFIFQIFLFTTRLISLLVGVYLFNDLVITLICYSVVNSINYLILTFYILRELRLRYLSILSKTVLLIIGIFTLLNLIRFGISTFI